MIRKVKQSLRAHQRTFTHFKLLFFFCFCFFFQINQSERRRARWLTSDWLPNACAEFKQAATAAGTEPAEATDFSFTCEERKTGRAQGGYEVNTNTPQSRRPCQRKQIERGRSGGNGKRLAGVNEQSEQSPFDRRAELRHSAAALCGGEGEATSLPTRQPRPVTGWKQQEKQCEGRAAAALTAAAVAACKQSREWVRGGTKTHRRVIHGKRCGREGAVGTFNADGAGAG